MNEEETALCLILVCINDGRRCAAFSMTWLTLLLCHRFLIDDMMTRYGHVDAFLESSDVAALDRDTVRLSDDPTAAADNNNTIKAKQKCAC